MLNGDSKREQYEHGIHGNWAKSLLVGLDRILRNVAEGRQYERQLISVGLLLLSLEDSCIGVV